MPVRALIEGTLVSTHPLPGTRERYLDKEGLFLYISISTDRPYRVGKTHTNVLGNTRAGGVK